VSVLQVPGSGDLLEQKPEIEARVREAQAAESGGIRDDLLRDLEPYILRVASKVCKRQISKQDDEFTIALVGLNEAISRYEPEQSSSFLSFAYMVIHRRLIDYYRHEKKHANQVPLVPPNAKENEPHHPEVVSRSFVQYQEEELARARRLEVKHFSQCLERFGIKMSELVKASPKHRDTREHLLEIASRIVADKDLLRDFYEQVKPGKELASRIGLHRRTLQRHRKYLVALTVVLVEDLPLMQEYLGLSSGKKGGLLLCERES
jgi:RNA polymerase sigma factor